MGKSGIEEKKCKCFFFYSSWWKKKSENNLDFSALQLFGKYSQTWLVEKKPNNIG